MLNHAKNSTYTNTFSQYFDTFAFVKENVYYYQFKI